MPVGIICFDIGRYDDALVNLSKAEQLLGVDLDIMQRKAVIYGIKNDIRNGLHTANQIKMIAPSEYKGYQIAFKLLIQAKRLETAEKELQMAEKYAGPSADYYADRITLELKKYRQDSDRAHFTTALTIIDKSLKTLKPVVKEVIESYINAAEIHLQLEDADRTIACLNAARNPADAYNNGFEVMEIRSEIHELSDYDVEDMIAEDRMRIEEELGEYGLEDLVQSVVQDDGTVANEQVGEDGVIVTLQAEFTYTDTSRTEIRALQVMPPVQGSSQWLRQQVQKQSGKQEAKSRTKETFQLPQTAEGQKIYWKTKETSDWYLFLLLGGAAVVCLEWQKRDQIKRQKKRREACLNREYPQMVEQLSLLMGAGLTLRRTWERILEMDQKMKKKKGYVERIYVQEMHRTYLDIRKGMGERQAYEQFAHRIGLPSYRRLISILNRNLEKGTRDVCEMLEEEAREAWEIRKNQAKKAGEEAGMKLLFPMMLLFILILVMLLFPAVQSFSL